MTSSLSGTERHEASVGVAPGLKFRVISGLSWSFLEMVMGNGISLIVRLILARLLLPEHFGVLGMAVIFTGLVTTISDLGLAAALVQTKKERLQRIHLDTAFWSSLGFNALVFVMLSLVIAPLAALFYGQDLLRIIIPIIGLSALINSANLIHRVLLTRELKFKYLGITQMCAQAIAGIIAIALALKGAGVWSLVFQSVIVSLISVPMLWRFAKWWPRMQFSKVALKEILGLSLYDAGQRVFIYLTKNVDYLLIGKLLGAVPLGIYTLAFIITDTFRQQLMGILNKVMFPVYGQLQDDPDRIKSYYLRIVKFNVALLIPFIIPLILFTDPIIRHILGEKWIEAVFPIQAMAIASIIHAAGGTTDSVLKGIGRFDLVFKITSLKALLFGIPAISLGIYFFGVNGAAVAFMLSKLVSRMVWQYYMRRLIGVREMDILTSLKKPLAACIIVLPLVSVLRFFIDTTSALSTIVVVSTAVSAFCGCILLMHKAELAVMLGSKTRSES